MKRFLAATLALLAVCCAAPAQADSAQAPPVQAGAATSVQAYGKQNPQCVSWTNGCVLCSTDEAGDSHCSTPGIACEPHGLHCKLMRPR